MMSRRVGLIIVPITVAALAAAGCGSSSSSKPAAPASTPATPTMPSTGTGTGTGTAPNVSSALSGSAATPIGSTIVRAALIKRIAQESSFPKKDDAPWADCVIKNLQSNGVKTIGDAQANPAKVKNAGETCAKQILLGQH